ncbi:MAG: hypothetical protein ABR542_10595 [Desulfonatronovibrio sp.]
MDNDSQMSMVKEADAAFLKSSYKVIQRAKLYGTPVVVWENGKVTEVPAHVLEERLEAEREKAEGRGRETED